MWRFLLFLVCASLSAQTFHVSNVSRQELDELELFEQRDDVIKQVRDLCVAGDTGSYVFDVAAEVCLELKDQQASPWPTRAKVIPSGDSWATCDVRLTCETARSMWDGWDWNEPVGGNGTRRTVCASGCDYKTPQEAVDASALGDLIELQPETFGDAATGTVLSLGANHDFSGSCPTYTVIRSAGYDENFRKGVRVSPADAPKMATLIGGSNNSSAYAHVVRIEDYGSANVKAVDINSNVLTTRAAHGFVPGDEVVWSRRATAPYLWIDGDFDYTRRYWVLTTPSATTMTLSEAPGGSPVDIKTQPTPGALAIATLRKASRTISCWKLQGLEIEVPRGEGAAQSLISIHGSTPFADTMTSHIIMEHLYLHGQDNMTGPRRGIDLTGRYLSVRDSYISEITQTPQEAYAIEVRHAPGPVWIENNSLSATGMSYLVGATGQAFSQDNGSLGGIVLRNNYLWKKDDWYVQEIEGTPAGACHVGSQYKDTSGPTCYTCANGTWGAPDANCNNWIDWVVKNSWESKACSGCLNENLWADLSPYGDASQLYWLVVKMQTGKDEWYGANDIIFKNFRSRYTASGPVLRGPIGKHNTKKTGPVVLWNGLSTEVDPVLYRFEKGTTSNVSMQLGQAFNGIELRHITQVGRIDSEAKPGLMAPATEEFPLRKLSIRDSILYTDDFRANSTKFGCTSLRRAVSDPYSPYLERNVFINPPGGFGAAGVDYSACAKTYHSEIALSDIGFADPAQGDFRLTGPGRTNDYRSGHAQAASDGKDMGVDFEVLLDGLGGNDPKAGRGSWSSQYGVSITAVSTTTARVEFDRPSENACHLTLYSDYARTVEHADTDTADEKLDSREGNELNANHIKFELGTNEALSPGTQYWFEIDCADSSIKMVGSLLTSRWRSGRGERPLL